MPTEAHALISPAVRRQTIADALRRTALRLPQKLGIVCGNTSWTYAEFDAIVSRLAAGLSGIGVKSGDRVAVLARNSHGFAALRFALARMGAVMVPINFMLKAEEVAYILRHAGAETLATDTGLADLAQQASKLDTLVKQFVWLPSEDPTCTTKNEEKEKNGYPFSTHHWNHHLAWAPHARDGQRLQKGQILVRVEW